MSSIKSVLFIFDESGSMATMGDEPRQCLNSFYEDQKKVGDFLTTLVFFNHEVRFKHTNISSSNITDLTKEDYHPDGTTALYDAIGKTIDYQKSQSVDDVIVVILTDGQDNCSRLYSRSDIKEMIQTMEQDHNWNFIYLGANQDSFQVAKGLGIINSIDYDNTSEGFCVVMRTVSETVSQCISHDTPIVTLNTDSNIQEEDEFPPCPTIYR